MATKVINVAKASNLKGNDKKLIASHFKIPEKSISYESFEGTYYGKTNEGWHFIAGRANDSGKVDGDLVAGIYKTSPEQGEPDNIVTIAK